MEVLLELVLDGMFFVSQNKKFSKGVRYFFISFIVLMFLGVAALIIFTGVMAYQKMDRLLGIILILLGIVFVIASGLKFRKMYLNKKKF